MSEQREVPELVDAGDTSATTSEFKRKPRVVERLHPLGDRVVVLQDSPEEMIGSFYVPDTAQQRPARGTVIATGPKVETVEPGQVILFADFVGNDAMSDGQQVKILREDDVFCVVERYIEEHPVGE